MRTSHSSDHEEVLARLNALPKSLAGLLYTENRMTQISQMNRLIRQRRFAEAVRTGKLALDQLAHSLLSITYNHATQMLERLQLVVKEGDEELERLREQFRSASRHAKQEHYYRAWEMLNEVRMQAGARLSKVSTRHNHQHPQKSNSKASGKNRRGRKPNKKKRRQNRG